MFHARQNPIGYKEMPASTSPHEAPQYVIVSVTPIMIKIIPATICITLPIFILVFIIKRFVSNKWISVSIKINGNEVATPKIAGKIKPYEVVTTVGMSQTKKSTNIVGQKAMAKQAPIINEPSFPSFNTSGIRVAI